MSDRTLRFLPDNRRFSRKPYKVVKHLNPQTGTLTKFVYPRTKFDLQWDFKVPQKSKAIKKPVRFF